nr:173K exoantigen - malaria parasite (Plasmodium falciparum) (fragments) [Plasmodium falciparum]
GLPPELPLFPI